MSDDMEQIELDFLASWDKVERFFKPRIHNGKEHRNHEHMLEVISKLRDRGYDKTLRAGQSMETLVLSRARHHGLRRWFTRLYITLHDESVKLKFFYDDIHEEYEFDTIILNNKFIEVLEKLVSHPVDDDYRKSTADH